MTVLNSFILLKDLGFFYPTINIFVKVCLEVVQESANNLSTVFLQCKPTVQYHTPQNRCYEGILTSLCISYRFAKYQNSAFKKNARCTLKFCH